MLSNSFKYAIKGVLYLALHSNENHKIMVRDIYRVIHVPEAYLAKLWHNGVETNLTDGGRGA
ncbi:hypothetical protein [Flagellimonas olearia]|uniref:hypothetical protein n=1 Tax=Flagellimonas olearia TaxID=552546 RepID=UPI0020130B7E|nr:hypothetical protein [Allomuricauda olearia]